ncbi:MAG: hypothetical protein BMS9Abin37_0992 [Acidobacteriota bacterium]|nr:MAG: hypothetical protein BMS9Abin37_0992 [Acidobacteriota bacterium]
MLVSALLLLALFLVGFALQSRFRFFEYLFYCRFPVLAALALGALLPGGMFVFGRSVIGNLGDVTYAGMFWVAFVSTLTAWTVMFAAALVLRSVPKGLDKALERGEHDRPGWLSTLSTSIAPTRIVGEKLAGLIRWSHDVTIGDGTVKRSRLVLYHTLTWWLLAGTAWKSSQTLANGAITTSVATLLWNTALVFVGIGAAVLLRLAATWTNERFEIGKGLSAHAMKRAPGTDRDFWQGGGFFLLLFGVYAFGWWWWQPGGVGPPLLPLLVVLNVLCLGLTLISCFLDEYRIGVVFGLVVTTFVSFSIFNIDHYYELISPKDSDFLASTERELTPRTVVCQWRLAHPEHRNPTMVIVTASGGGLTAARWTTTVLSELQDTNEKFVDSIVLMSTASGGGVGAMYFIDAFEESHLTKDALNNAKELAGDSSLLSTAWGLAYQDVFAFLPRLGPRKDRGWALEETWKLRIDDPKSTLRHWKQDVLDGWRPVPIFNATVAETGERFLITPMNLKTTESKDYFNNLPAGLDSKKGASITSNGVRSRRLWDAKQFFELYPKSDIHVATAARLSAAFPFVSPIPEPTGLEATTETAFHIADGGYYDNHGVMSAIDFLRDVLPQYDEIAKQCHSDATPPQDDPVQLTVLIVQIRAGAPGEKKPERGDGYAWATIGPIDTLTHVRTSSQISRNDTELELLFEEFRGKAEMHAVVFDLGDADLPLSWHLSDVDKQRIEVAWRAQPEALVEAVDALLK